MRLFSDAITCTGVWHASNGTGAGSRLPSIVITADHTQSAQTAASARGCQILRKPVKPAALRAVMNSVLA